MKRRHSKKPAEQRAIAEERIRGLFGQAEDMFRKDRKYSNRYVSLARRISMKYKVKIPLGLKRRFCKHCHCYLKPGVNCRVRLAKGNVIYYCLECRKFMRFRIGKRKAKRER
ncbi:ribonuclease P [Candidatus Woesearchaeota archaeon CG10_big_fil_rev_8_21_14_0_10_44_13]|nr:MAG: ribonuclease P [Candidatus Woesearchaeota archaeon CG10_big_fil_rev_8_21_14_0_10_44_13]